MNGDIGRAFLILGLILVAAGLIISFAPRIPWLGKMPGDIYIRRENFTFYFPLATSIIISLLISFLSRFFR